MVKEFGEYGVPLHYHYSQVHSDLVVVSVRVPSMDQIELFGYLLGTNKITNVK